MSAGKMMTRAATWGAGCGCFDCCGGRDRGQQRRLEDREWRSEWDDEDTVTMGLSVAWGRKASARRES